MAGNSEVALSWDSAENAVVYKVYWSTSPTLDRTNSSSMETTNTSAIITGLTNGVTYYFAVAGTAAYTETALSEIVHSMPEVSNLGTVDLEGTWNFNILVSGDDAGWMRGQVTITSGGAVSFGTFVDNTGNSEPPNDLFATWTVHPDGSVSQTGSATTFVGALSKNTSKDILVGTATRGASSLIAIFQKVTGASFSDNDIKAYGGSNPRYFAYNQISSGDVEEWEFGVAKIGGTAPYPIEYMAFDSSARGTSTLPTTTVSDVAKPYLLTGNNGKKSSVISISLTGTVTESAYTGGSPSPYPLAGGFFAGIMSADKTLIVGTFTDSRYNKYILRIYQIINPNASDYSTDQATPLSYDFWKPYHLQKIFSGATASSSCGAFTVNGTTSGTISYTDGGGNPLGYTDGFAFTTIPTISSTLGAILTNPADLSFYGKVSRNSYLTVFTKTESDGRRSLTLGIQRP
jgi:hypothetical protein